MRILLINNNDWLWWMWLHWTIFSKMLKKYCNELSVYNEAVNWIAPTEFIESFDKIIRYSRYQGERLGFKNADFLKNISKNKNKNILFIFSDATLFPEEAIDIINNHFYKIACDSEFSEQQAKKSWIKNICGAFQFILDEDLINKRTLNPTTKDQDSTYNFLHISSRTLQKVKWVDVILQAFLDWFTPQDNVKLNILTNEKYLKNDYLPTFIKEFEKQWKWHQLNVIQKPISHVNLASLYRTNDCYINASRLETLWIPPIEAAIFWLKLISIEEHWSSEYIHNIQHSQVLGKFWNMPEDIRRDNKSSIWFDPSLDSLKAAMISCYKEWKEYNRNPEDIKFLLEKYNPDKIIKKFISII